MANDALGMHALTNLSSQMKVISPAFRNALRANLRAGIKAASQPVVDGIKERASWSTRIPAAVGVSTRYQTNGASVRVQVDHNKAPHARPFELGNKRQFDEVLVSQAAKGLNAGRRQPVSRRAAIAAARKQYGAGAISGSLLRHPVFHKIGSPGGFATEPTRPFFFPAINAAGNQIDLTLEQVVVKTARDAGFK